MGNQSWKTAVELDMAGGRPFVRVIDNGVVHIRLFEKQSEAAAFAQIEKVRLGIERIATR